MSNSFIETVKFILENCPFGFLNQIDFLLRKININLINQNIEEYNKLLKQAEEGIFRQIPYGESSAIISPYNKINDQYFCQTKTEHIKFQINPLSSNLSNLDKVENDIPLRQNIYNAIEEYVNKHYPSQILGNIINDLKGNFSSKSGFSALAQNNTPTFVGEDNEKTVFYVNYNDLGSGKYEVYIVISSHHLCFTNNQTAKWISFYKLTSVGKNEYKINGWLKIGNYYYEADNNSHFNLEEDLKETNIKADTEEELCKEIVKIIEEFENRIEEGLYDLFDDFNEEVMKPLRRNVTVTGTKPTWDSEKPTFSSLKDEE